MMPYVSAAYEEAYDLLKEQGKKNKTISDLTPSYLERLELH